MEWKDAIISVLRGEPEPVHYADIAAEIAKRKLRSRTQLGATPASTVAAIIGVSLKDEGDRSPFVRVSRGYYAWRGSRQQQQTEEVVDAGSSSVAGIINALGMFWERSKVAWQIEPRLYGKQQPESEPVDFCKQIGVYFLHDIQGVVYVGRATDQTLGRRLYQHTIDRLNGRWDRFS